MQILIFGGTTEGRNLSYVLAEKGAEITVCVATAYGAEEQGEFENITVLEGRKDIFQMQELLPKQDICIDATHPYAVEVTKNIKAACEGAGIPYLRLLREETVDMFTTVFIGSESTKNLSGRMVTPRGYERKCRS